jgi:hypothetical protein
MQSQIKVGGNQELAMAAQGYDTALVCQCSKIIQVAW